MGAICFRNRRSASSSRLDYLNSRRNRRRARYLDWWSHNSVYFITLGWPPMTAILPSLHISLIIFLGAFLFNSGRLARTQSSPRHHLQMRHSPQAE